MNYSHCPSCGNPKIGELSILFNIARTALKNKNLGQTTKHYDPSGLTMNFASIKLEFTLDPLGPLLDDFGIDKICCRAKMMTHVEFDNALSQFGVKQ